MTPPGMRIIGSLSFGPASRTQTETAGSSVRRLASTQPAGPPPTITKSNSSGFVPTMPAFPHPALVLYSHYSKLDPVI